MEVRGSEKARQDPAARLGEAWRRPYNLSPAFPPVQLPPRTVGASELGTSQYPETAGGCMSLASPAVHPPPQWGQSHGIAHSISPGLFLPVRSPTVQPPNQSELHERSHHIHQIKPISAGPYPNDGQSVQKWFDQATRANDKAKALFSVVSTACQSFDCTSSDVQRLLSISFEKLVRALDYVAASAALKALAIQERQWSTEPNGEGFRMAGKEARGFIDRNNIDPNRLLYRITNDGVSESRQVLAIAEESVIEQQRVALLRQAAKEAANMVDIPLYTDLDNFLELADQQYKVECDKSPRGAQPQQEAGLPRPAGRDEPYAPQNSLGGLLVRVEGNKPSQTGANPPATIRGNVDVHPILVKEGYLASTGTFDRRSQNTWNDLSPNFDGGAGCLPWGGQDEMLVNGPTIAAMATDVLDDLNSPFAGAFKKVGQAEKSTSSNMEGGAVERARTTPAGLTKSSSKAGFAGDRAISGQEKNAPPTPSCFCGISCEKKSAPGGVTYFGCKDFKCEAQIPVSDLVPHSTNDDSETLIKVNSDLKGTHSKKRKRRSDSLLAQGGSPDAEARDKVGPDAMTKANGSTKSNSMTNAGMKNAMKGVFKTMRQEENDKASSRESPGGPIPRPADGQGFLGTTMPSKLCDPNQGAKVPRASTGSPKRLKSPATGKSGDVAPSLEEMIRAELATVPLRMRCRKVDPSGQGRLCLQSLRPGIGGSAPSGHLGRCRYKPRNAAKSMRGVSDAPAYQASNISSPAPRQVVAHPLQATEQAINMNDTEKSFFQVAVRDKDSGPTSMAEAGAADGLATALLPNSGATVVPETSTLSLPTSSPSLAPMTHPDATIADKSVERTQTMHAKETEQIKSSEDTERTQQVDTTKGGGDADSTPSSEATEIPDVARDDTEAARRNSLRLLENVSSHSKPGEAHANGEGLLRHEFSRLSAKKIAASYGCSTLIPPGDWNAQKQELLAQCRALHTHPILHAEIVGTTAIRDCTAQPTLLINQQSLPYIEEASGLFANVELGAGNLVAELVGETISTVEANDREKEYASLIASGSGLSLKNIIGDPRGHLKSATDMMFSLNERWVLDTTRAGSSARFARRVQGGNCRLGTFKDPAGAIHVYLQTLTELKKGDEITIQCM